MCFTALGNANDTKEQDVFICGNDSGNDITVETWKELKTRMFPQI